MSKFFVFIIESNKKEEIVAGYGLSEAKALSQMLTIAGIDHKVRGVIDKYTLAQAIAEFASIASQSQTFPVLHIAAHGNERGLGLTDNQLIEWRELYQMLMPAHAVRLGQFLLSMSSCFGMAAIKMAAVNIHVPLFGVVGT